MVINLYGEPCAGKSVAASYIFSKLNMAGVKCEYVTEFAKHLTFEHNNNALSNQIYVFANQFYKIDTVYKQTDVVITDCPLMLCTLYANNIFSPELLSLARKCNSMYESYNILLKRGHKYNPIGRNEDEEQSSIIRSNLYTMLKNENIVYDELDSTVANYDMIVKRIARRFGCGD